MKIYTRQGDDGSTGLYGGRRVSKADPRVEAYGLLDEVNAVLGWSRAAGLPAEIDAALAAAQETCFRLGAWLACPPGADPQVPPPAESDVDAVEAWIDGLEERLPPLKHFILPGGGEGGARLHVARTVTRRAERAIAALAESSPVPERAIPWVNRLSDYLFVAARAANAAAGATETPWTPRAR